MKLSPYFSRRNSARPTIRPRGHQLQGRKRRLTVERLEGRSLLAGFPFTIGGNFEDEGTSVVTDTSGNVYVAGNFGETVDFDPALQQGEPRGVHR